MQRDLASRPASPPGDPAVTLADEAVRPSGRALALEGLVVYLVLLLLTIPFLPALRSAKETFYDDVLLGFFGPEKHGLAELLRSGFLPTWLDNQYGGEPFLANLQHGVLYIAGSGWAPAAGGRRWPGSCSAWARSPCSTSSCSTSSR
jgi:hypothetical protein